MSLNLYNSALRAKAPFVPINRSNVRVYMCGPTVYDRIHIGNGRAFSAFDLLVRMLRHHYGASSVTYVRNITDVDDKINARAAERGIDISDLTQETTAILHADLAALNLLVPDVEPRATQHIPDMIAMIAVLIEKGHAYLEQGHVLFHVPSFSDYGALSRRSLDDMMAGARVEVAPYKRDPMDFVLWKPSADSQPGWPSPWGRGRPGWHIECSAMAKRHLGAQFDIHGGGIDLQFPHHENERAQSMCAHDGHSFANVWFHNGFLTIDAEKMSKSLGNFTTVEAARQRMPGEAVRYALLMAHYRQPADWSDTIADEAKTHLDRWYRLTDGVDAGDADMALITALDDDLNTPRAFAELHRLAGEAAGGSQHAAASLKASAQLMGFLGQSTEAWFRWSPSGIKIDPDWVDERIAARRAARAAKDFALADKVRQELTAAGIILEDGPKGTTWRVGP
jgi:cysteinyl-tRNA synthetase